MGHEPFQNLLYNKLADGWEEKSALCLSCTAFDTPLLTVVTRANRLESMQDLCTNFAKQHLCFNDVST